mgnify:CR=1 FL=1
MADWQLHKPKCEVERKKHVHTAQIKKLWWPLVARCNKDLRGKDFKFLHPTNPDSRQVRMCCNFVQMSSDELQTRTFGRNVRQIANSSGRDAQLIANSSTPTRPSTVDGLTSGRVRMDCKFHPARRP